MELTNTSAVVTGGASGLGEATARALARARRARRRRRPQRRARRGASPSEIGGAYAHCDVTDTDQVIAAIEAATALAPLWSVGQLRGHRLGDAHHRQGRRVRVSAHDLDLYRKVIEINLVGTFNVCRLAATAMSHNDARRRRLRGAIVNTASVAAEDGQIGQVAYSSSKGGVVGLTLPARARPRGRRRAGELHPARPHRHPHLRHRPGQSDEFKARLGAGRALPQAPRLRRASSRRSPSSCWPTAT